MPPAKKTRPPRIYLDKKSNRYYIIQNKVKRFFDENDLTKIVEAVKTGKLAYKTSKKSKTWLETFKPQAAPVNNDTGFLPGELTPIERRKIEKAKLEVYGNAVERYKQEQEELEDQKDEEKIKISEPVTDNNKKMPEIEESKYEKEIKIFLKNLTVANIETYVKSISDSQPVLLWKDQYVTFILADPKVSKIAQLAYIKLAEKGKVKFDDFYNKSLEIKKSAVGFGSEDDYDGLYGDEIIKIMKPYKGFLGVIMNDEIPTLIEDSLHYDRFGFVINTDNSDMDGSHWCAIFVDIPDGSIEYFDSFGDEPSEEIKRDMAELIKEHDINYLMKFKVNGQKVQDLRTGSCGWFAMKFLIDRFNGVPFATASGFKVTSIGSKRGESKVKTMKKSFGYI